MPGIEDPIRVGIATGAGPDTIVHSGGSISVGSPAASASSALSKLFKQDDEEDFGIAIDAGTGNDTVLLAGDSVVHDHIQLGDGHDTLHLSENATHNGHVLSGEGSDSISISDRGSFEIEHVVDHEHFLVNQGTLTIGRNQPVLDGVLQAEIHSGGSGKLVLSGTTQLSSEAQVVVKARPRAFQNSETFEILTAGTLDDSQFNASQIELPKDTPLVTFAAEVVKNDAAADAIEVTTSAQPIHKVAKNGLSAEVAGYLEKLRPNATGDLGELIGSFQLLDNSPCLPERLRQPEPAAVRRRDACRARFPGKVRPRPRTTDGRRS